MASALEIFVRLNLRHVPNTEQILRELPKGVAEANVEFDLACAKINEKRIERMWLDLIFGAPQMNAVCLRDLGFSRAQRTDL